ncbi:MAG TPA: hypothetical protein VMJ35_01750 [Dongiaceae bacterium]|nr:hypothetical protein [Dongiaceae bacterium]
MRRPLFLILLASAFLSIASTHAQNMPPVNAKALDDSQVVLPKPGGSQLLILVLGFSHKSGDNCSPWDRKLATDYRSDATVEYYQIPVLAGAPSFVRPMILKGMRKGVPPDEQSRFVPVYDHEAEWKKLVNFKEPDDPYILLTRPDGTVVWQTHGLFNEDSYVGLKNAITKAAAEMPKK